MKIEVRDSRPGFLWISNSFFDTFAKQLHGSALITYLCLARFANNTTQKCFPSYELLAERTGLSRSAVAEALQELKSFDLIHWYKEGRHNVYCLLDTNSPKNGLVQNGEGNSPVLTSKESTPVDSNKTKNKTQEQELVLSPPSGEPTNGNGHSKDVRHVKFRHKLEKFWKYMNPEIALSWSAGEAGQLATFLRRWPNLTIEDFHSWLLNYSQSEGIVETKTPREFLPFLHQYAKDPLDQFHKPLRETTQ